MITVTIYTKPGCHLCAEAFAVILETTTSHPFHLEERNILDNPSDYDRYKHGIPVICVNGKEIARHRLTPEVLDRALDQAYSPPRVEG